MTSYIHGQTLPFHLLDEELAQFDGYVGGQQSGTSGTKRFEVFDPGTGQPWAHCRDYSASEVDSVVQLCHNAFLEYSKWTPRRRSQCLLQWHRLIIDAREDLAKILVHETGKPLNEAYGEIDYATTFSWWFVGEAERTHGSTITSAAPGRRSFTIKQPVGVAAALVPWNFPIALALRKASAALAAGCTMIVKPSPETPISAPALAVLARRAGFPSDSLNVVTTSLENTPMVAEALCLHELVKKVSFTGSTRVGKIISGLCARNLKTPTLELGGNCPFIVFDDADLDDALNQLMALKWRHAGQACVSANRVYIQRGVHAKFTEMIIEATRKLRIGHGMTEGTTMGPVTTLRGLEKAEALAIDAVERGARVALGNGKRSKESATSKGYFMPPTVLEGVTDDMFMSQDEVFSPVLGLSVFNTEDEVVRRANNTPMGLTSYVFTKNVDRLWRMFEKLETGMVGLNTGNNSAAEAPFGGIKESGWGKESGKDVAVEEFLVTKTGTLTVADHY